MKSAALVCTLAALAAAASVLSVLGGCSPAPDDPAAAVPGAPVDAAEPGGSMRFPSPPGSRSLASSIEPGVLAVPLGPASDGAGAPTERIDGTIRRRLNVLGMAEDGSGLADFYRAQVESGGYRVLFECEGLEACGGPGFVSTVAETFLTQPRSNRNAAMLNGLMRPEPGLVLHYSLRGPGDGDHLVTVTVVRSDTGPVAVLTQSSE